MILPNVRHKKQLENIRDSVLELVAKSDRTWGIGRLPLLVADELRERWHRQAEKFEAALREGHILSVRQHALGMQKGLEALDAAARAAGHEPLAPEIWEVELPDGSLVGLVRTQAENLHLADAGRYSEIYTVREVGIALAKFGSDVRLVKRNFPGGEVTGVRSPLDDSVDDLGR